MIPADHWHDNGDGTAWVVASDPRNVWGVDDIFDRPCDTCTIGPKENPIPCPDCDGTGRHTFTVDTYCEQQCDVYPCKWKHNSSCSGGTRTLRVSVVPDMVLPIVTSDGWVEGAPCIEANPYGEFWLWPDPGLLYQQGLTLPPAAAPGMWAVKLAVRS